MMRRLLAMSLAIFIAPMAMAAPAIHAGPPASPIAASVEVPAGADMIFLSGVLPPVVDKTATGSAAYGDTTTQTVNALKIIKDRLAEKGLGLGDVVMMRIYMVGDPARNGRMDFEGMMVGYKQVFGTPEQPNKPARSTVQVVALALPGPAMEIEVEAVRTH